VPDYLSSGMSIEEIIENYPPLSLADVEAALVFIDSK
jgi:uncharacterized protein (DUF433 family)